MLSQSPKIPSYRHQKSRDTAVVNINGRDIYLGKYKSPESRAKYDKPIQEWLASGRLLTSENPIDERAFSVAELILGYMKYAKIFYQKDGKPTSHLHNVEDSMTYLKNLYGLEAVKDFGPLKLKAVRQQMIGKGLGRTTINKYIDNIKRMFKWGTENELVPSSIFHGLQAISGLRKGRCEAKEYGPVKPVPEAFIEAVKEHVSDQVWAMIQLQMFTGMRPGEVVLMRRLDIDTTGKLWVYTPQHHKTEHHGITRPIYLGPKAKEVVKKFMKSELAAYLFDPRDLPTDGKGIPLPSSQSNAYYHPKEGVFTDAEGNQVGFSGSVNESATALEDNYESFMVFNSWDNSPAHLGQIRIKFDRLWEGKERDWLAMLIPEAVKPELLKFRPKGPPLLDPLEKPPQPPEPQPEAKVDADQHERILFQFLRDAPYMLNAGRLGLDTSVVKPWPHQVRVVDTIIEKFPERFLLCDEVGLGKTVEAGSAIRQLVLSGRVKRALILVPRSVIVQWQEELYEKFVLSIPRYDGHCFSDVFGRELKVPAGTNPWDAHPIMLASSQLAKRRERQDQLLEAADWDLLVVDEAHHARRKDFLNRDQYRPNRLLELLQGNEGRKLIALVNWYDPLPYSQIGRLVSIDSYD